MYWVSSQFIVIRLFPETLSTCTGIVSHLTLPHYVWAEHDLGLSLKIIGPGERTKQLIGVSPLALELRPKLDLGCNWEDYDTIALRMREIKEVNLLRVKIV